MPETPPSITQHDLARLAGVTRLTVGRALSGQPGVGADTASRIRQLAREHGYRPHAAARALRRGKTHTIGLLYSSRSPLLGLAYGPLTAGIVETLRASDYNLQLLAVQPGERHRDDQFLDRRLDGCIVHHELSPQVRAALERAGLPAVLVNARGGDEAWPEILPDDRQGTTDLMQHLLGLGHRRIAWMTYDFGVHGHFSAALRQAMAEQVMAAAGLRLQPHLIPTRHDSEAEAFAHLAATWRDAPATRPTAVVLDNEYRVHVAVKAFKRAGLRIPEDLSFAVFDDGPVQQAMEPALTAVRIPFRELGDRAAHRLIEGIDGENPGDPDRSRTELIAESLIVRDSTSEPSA